MPEPPITALDLHNRQSWAGDCGVRADGPWRVWMPPPFHAREARAGLSLWRTVWHREFPWAYARSLTSYGRGGVVYAEGTMMIGSWNLDPIEELDALRNHRDHIQNQKKFFKEYHERTHSSSAL